MTRAELAQAASLAARATRTNKLREAWLSYMTDSESAHVTMPFYPEEVTQDAIDKCRLLLTVCLAHLDEMQRLVGERDGIVPGVDR